MKVTVIIPTCSLERTSLLIQTVDSILAGSYKDIRIVIVADGNRQIYEMASKNYRGIWVLLNEKRIDWPASINRVLKGVDSEYYIYASDDLTFPPDCIKHAMTTMQRHFPDGDGVVSLGRKGRCIFGLLGRKFADRFPGREVFCPDFIHYRSDSELLRTVKELKKLAYPPQRDSQVVHLRRKDETWRLARKVRDRDRKVYREREVKGYKWGIDFNLVTRKND